MQEEHSIYSGDEEIPSAEYNGSPKCDERQEENSMNRHGNNGEEQGRKEPDMADDPDHPPFSVIPFDITDPSFSYEDYTRDYERWVRDKVDGNMMDGGGRGGVGRGDGGGDGRDGRGRGGRGWDDGRGRGRGRGGWDGGRGRGRGRGGGWDDGRGGGRREDQAGNF